MGIAEFDELKEPIIDVGCGTGRILRLLELSGKNKNFVTGIDLSSISIDKCIEQNIRSSLFVMDAMNLKFVDNSFNTVICHGVAHHTVNPKKVFSECERVCSKEGIIIFSHYRKYSFYYWDYKFLKNIMRFFLRNKLYIFMQLWILVVKNDFVKNKDSIIRRFADRYTPIAHFKTFKELQKEYNELGLILERYKIINRGVLIVLRLRKTVCK